jgi:hypothetical protein
MASSDLSGSGVVYGARRRQRARRRDGVRADRRRYECGRGKKSGGVESVESDEDVEGGMDEGGRVQDAIGWCPHDPSISQRHVTGRPSQ